MEEEVDPGWNYENGEEGGLFKHRVYRRLVLEGMRKCIRKKLQGGSNREERRGDFGTGYEGF